MMIENMVTISKRVNERDYIFLLKPDSPLGETYDVLCEMREVVMKKMKEISQEDKREEKVCSEDKDGCKGKDDEKS